MSKASAGEPNALPAAGHTGLGTPGVDRGLACEEQLNRRWDVSAAF